MRPLPTGCCLLLGSLGIFFGTANNLLHLPFAILLYPAALYVLALRSDSPFRLGWLAGMPGAAAALYWIAVAAHLYGGFPWPLAAPCSMLLGMYVALWGGLFAWIMARSRRFPAWRRCLAAGFLWHVLEWCRGWFCSGFPWLGLSSGLAAWPVCMQPLSVLGAYGYSGILAFLACLFCEAAGVSRHGANGSAPARRGASLLAAAALLALIFGFGLWRMDALRARLAVEGDPLVLSLVQGNVQQDQKWTPEYQRAALQKYVRLSLGALQEGRVAGAASGSMRGNPADVRASLLTSLGRGMDAPVSQADLHAYPPDMLLWPETCMPFLYGASPYDALLRAFARDVGVPLLFGSLGTENAKGESLLYNRASLVDASGKDAGKYSKEHLVPFGEYLPPILDWQIFEPLLQGLGGFASGGGDPLFVLRPAERPAVRMGMLICYEAIFPELARQRVGSGADLLLNISNDAWYDRTSAPLQHLQLAAMRAVEQGRYLARSTNTGITACIDPLGGMQAPAAPAYALFSETWLTGKVLALAGHTPYFYLHPWLPAVSLIALALLCRIWAWRPRQKRRV